jgi:hypothetical protein
MEESVRRAEQMRGQLLGEVWAHCLVCYHGPGLCTACRSLNAHLKLMHKPEPERESEGPKLSKLREKAARGEPHVAE